jgi:methionine aminopeptidase
VKLVKINSKLFPNRYKKYTNHDLSFGAVGIEGDEIKFFLDSRYFEFAKKVGLNFEPYENLPKKNVVLDPWEWSIGEFNSLALESYSFEFYEDYKIEHFFNDKIDLEVYENFAHENKLSFLVSHFDNIKKPSLPYFIGSGRVSCDSSLTPLAFNGFIKGCVKFFDPVRSSDSILPDGKVDDYKAFLKQDAQNWNVFLDYLYKNWQNIKESQAVLEFNKIREIGKNELAFETILGSGKNSAQIHGRPSNVAMNEGVCLIDAGVKINGFISDISRSVWLSDALPSDEIKEAYTKVLKAHILFASFKAKASDEGLIKEISKKVDEVVNFSHALGHGLGMKSGFVHAFPAISKKSSHFLRPGMIITNEPGFYVQNSFGVRIENIMMVKLEADIMFFEVLSYIPLEFSLIIDSMLTVSEKKWLKKYHEKCAEDSCGILKRKIEPFLSII